MAAVAFLQFIPRLFETPAWRIIVFCVLVIALVCFVAAEVVSKKERKKWEEGQEGRERKLAALVAREVRSSPTLSREFEQRPPDANPQGMSSTDPRIYVSIESATEAMFPRTPFVFHNQGKDTAHDVTVEPFKLDRKKVEIPSVPVIAAGDKAESLPEIEKADGTMNKYDIFNWLLKDWNANGELVEEWVIPLRVRYSDFSKKRRFVSTMNLVFHPIRYIMSEKNNWPDYKDALWEMRDIDFKQEN